MPRKKTSKKRVAKNYLWLKLAVGIGLLIAVAVGIYSVNAFLNSEQEEEGFFVCDSENKICELSQHIHSDIKVVVCNKEITFPKEEGDLSEPHTHKEEAVIHWHDRMRVDPITREPLDPTPLKLLSFLQQMKYDFPKTCPNNSFPTLSITVNGEKIFEKLDYTWKDGDDIIVEYQ